jgi:MYXO-CTERM domain-containing protein
MKRFPLSLVVMKRFPLSLVVLAAALVVPPIASAKEPTAATIEGPGLAGPLTIRGSSDDQDGSPLARLVTAGGVGAAMFGHRIPDPMKRNQPAGELGPRYSVTYVVGGPDGTAYELTGEIYPYAEPRPLTYMEPGQPFFETFTTHGGWFVGGPRLKQALLDAGLPSQQPSAGGYSPTPIVGTAAGLVALLGVGLVLLRRRRPRPRAAKPELT